MDGVFLFPPLSLLLLLFLFVSHTHTRFRSWILVTDQVCLLERRFIIRHLGLSFLGRGIGERYTEEEQGDGEISVGFRVLV